jgi:MFS transporter, DHA1 family, tetracycline resistance protein
MLGCAMPRTPAGRSAVLFIFITVLVDSIGLGIILPVLPELIMQLTGEGISRASIYGGWLWFIYALMQFFCAPILGNLGDRFGRRPVILFSLLALGIDYLIMGFAPRLAWLFVGRTVAGMAGASYTPAYAYLADVSPPDKRAQNFGLVGAAFGTGFILGPAIGGLLGALGPRAPFFAAAGCALLNFAFGWFVLPESLPLESRRPFDIRRANPLGTLLQIRRRPGVMGLAAAVFLWQLGHQSLPSTWSYYTMFKFHWSEAQVGGSLAFIGIVMAIGTGGLTRVLVPHLGESRAALTGLVMGILGFVGYAFATQGWMMYTLMPTWLLASLVYPSMQAIMSRRIPADAQGELQGGIACIYSISCIAGPPLMTQLFGRFSEGNAPIQFPGAAFLCSAFLATGSLLLFLRTLGPRAEHTSVLASSTVAPEDATSASP